LALAPIVARLLEPAAKLATARMLDSATASHSLGEMLGLGRNAVDLFCEDPDGLERDAGNREQESLPVQTPGRTELGGRHILFGSRKKVAMSGKPGRTAFEPVGAADRAARNIGVVDQNIEPAIGRQGFADQSVPVVLAGDVDCLEGGWQASPGIRPNFPNY
jgi:hypothetical protein